MDRGIKAISIGEEEWVVGHVIKPEGQEGLFKLTDITILPEEGDGFFRFSVRYVDKKLRKEAVYSYASTNKAIFIQYKTYAFDIRTEQNNLKPAIKCKLLDHIADSTNEPYADYLSHSTDIDWLSILNLNLNKLKENVEEISFFLHKIFTQSKDFWLKLLKNEIGRLEELKTKK